MSHNYQYHSDSDSDLEIETRRREFLSDPVTLNNLNMATPKLEKYYLDMIPDFYGDSKLLPRFIEICEKLVTKFYNSIDEADFQNEFLMSSIIAKIKGDAAINIASTIINKWDDLKQALLNAYSDKRDLYTLNIEITELRQGNETPFEFYSRVQDLLNLQISYINTHTIQEARPVLIAYFQNYALRILLRGLKEPLGTLMRTKDPKNMNTALNMLTNDFQLETHTRNHTQNKNTTQHMQQPHKHKQNTHTQFGQPQKQIIYRPLPQNQIFKQNNQFRHNQPFNKPFNNQHHNNQFHKPNNQSQQNVFRPNPNFKPNNNQTPMSISTRQSTAQRPTAVPYRPSQFYPSQNRPNNYIVEELFNTETETYTEPENDQNFDFCVNDQNLEYHADEPDQNEQNEFFQIDASETTSN